MDKPKKRKKNKRRNNGNIPYIPEGKLQAAVPDDIQKKINESPEEFENIPVKKDEEGSETSSSGAEQFPLKKAGEGQRKKKKKRKRKDVVPFIPEGKLQAVVPDDIQKKINDSPEEFDNDPKAPKKPAKKVEKPEPPKIQERPRKPLKSLVDVKPKPVFKPYSEIQKYPLPVPNRKPAGVASMAEGNNNQLLSGLPPEALDILLHASRVIRTYSSAERDDLDLLINLTFEYGEPKIVFMFGEPFD